jgi:hypothetical protein
MHGIRDEFMKDGKENLQGKTRKTTQTSVRSPFWASIKFMKHHTNQEEKSVIAFSYLIAR